MNTRIVLGLVALCCVFVTPSFAARQTARSAVITCSNAKLDKGFILTAAGRGDKFSIQEQSVVGPVQLAIATCRNVVPNVRVTPEAMVLSKVCTGADTR